MPAAARVRQGSSKKKKRRALHVLLVDDKEDNRDIYAQYLIFQGHRVSEAGNAPDGIVQAQEAAPDVVVMDLAMPGMDGYEAIQNLKAHPVTARIPVLVLSAHVFKDAQERAVAAGADGFCGKPCSPPDLLALIERLVPQPGPGKG